MNTELYKEIKFLSDKYASELRTKIDERTEEMKSDDNSHFLIYRVLVMVCIVIGSMQKVNLVWEMADMFNGFMVIPNLIALLLLSNRVVNVSRKYKMLD